LSLPHTSFIDEYVGKYRKERDSFQVQWAVKMVAFHEAGGYVYGDGNASQ
jgi:hypothetical protein